MSFQQSQPPIPGQEQSKHSTNDWPKFDLDVDLTNRPINYLSMRIKAVRKRELDELYRVPKNMRGADQKELIQPDLGIP